MSTLGFGPAVSASGSSPRDNRVRLLTCVFARALTCIAGAAFLREVEHDAEAIISQMSSMVQTSAKL